MKRLHIMLTVFICILTLQFTTLRAHAYTEEEKAAAKAWLSANGYAPTMGGAQQAYQDYLNGKFDSNGNREEQTEPPTKPPTTTDTNQTDNPDDSGNNKTPSEDKNKNNSKNNRQNDGTTAGSAVTGQPGLNPEDRFAAMADETDKTSESTAKNTESEAASEPQTETASQSDQETETESSAKVSKSQSKKAEKQSPLLEITPIIIGPVVIILVGIGIIVVKSKKGRSRCG